jgi:ABC-type sugar transport system ATPase subunit
MLVSSLSGGNQQKVILGKWLLTKPEIFLFDEPTRGIDVGAKAEIYAEIQKLVEVGKSVLMVSSELPEVIGLSDRVYVMKAGRIVGELSRDRATDQAVLELAL